MIVFATKTAELAEYIQIAERMETLLKAYGGNNEIMMMSTLANGRKAIYVGVPDARMIEGWGFTVTTRESLPDFMATDVINSTGFREKFPDIAAKMRSEI